MTLGLWSLNFSSYILTARSICANCTLDNPSYSEMMTNRFKPPFSTLFSLNLNLKLNIHCQYLLDYRRQWNLNGLQKLINVCIGSHFKELLESLVLWIHDQLVLLQKQYAQFFVVKDLSDVNFISAFLQSFIGTLWWKQRLIMEDKSHLLVC